MSVQPTRCPAPQYDSNKAYTVDRRGKERRRGWVQASAVVHLVVSLRK